MPRYLHESILESRTVDALTAEAEVAFYRILFAADGEGRFEATPAKVVEKAYPLRRFVVREPDVVTWLSQLERVGLIGLYEVDGRRYGTFNPKTWVRCQSTRKLGSSFPAPPAETVKLIESRAGQRHPPAYGRSMPKGTRAGVWKRSIGEAEGLLRELRSLWNAVAVPGGLSGWDATERGLTANRLTLARKAAGLPILAGTGEPSWRLVLEKIVASDFLTGRVKTKKCQRGYRATPDWFLKEDTPTKVLEGAFDNAAGSKWSASGATDFESLAGSGLYGGEA